jgi:hypothetical protein
MFFFNVAHDKHLKKINMARVVQKVADLCFR